jgi:hypothetical protein
MKFNLKHKVKLVIIPLNPAVITKFNKQVPGGMLQHSLTTSREL